MESGFSGQMRCTQGEALTDLPLIASFLPSFSSALWDPPCSPTSTANVIVKLLTETLVSLLFIYVCALSCFSRVQFFVTPWTVARQAPLSMGFSRQEDWSGLPFPPPGDQEPAMEPEMEPASLMPPAGRQVLTLVPKISFTD